MELDFGMRLAGNNNLGGNICKDDNSHDGVCNSGGETQLDEIEVILYDGNNRFFGGVETSTDGSYIFPYLPDDEYVVGVRTGQDSLSHYHLTTQTGDTPADTIRVLTSVIFQIVEVENY